MSCTKTENPLIGSVTTGALPVPGAGSDLTGPFLVVCNQPETIAEGQTDVQLYKASIPVSANEIQTIRIFVWHHSNTSGNTYSFRGRVDNGTGTIRHFVGYWNVVASGDLLDLGKCCAQALLYRQYPQSGLNNTLYTTLHQYWTGRAARDRSSAEHSGDDSGGAIHRWWR